MKVEKVDLANLAEGLGKLERMRDLAAHGIWIRGPNDVILLQDLSGNWKPDPKGEKVSRRITPEGVMVTAPGLRHLAESIRAMRKITEVLGNEVRGKLKALREKSQPQSLEDHLPPDHNQEKL